MAQIILAEGAEPNTPSTGKVSLFAKIDGRLYAKDDAGITWDLGVYDGTYEPADPTILKDVDIGVTVCALNDARLSDARTPTTHTHPPASITQSGATTGQALVWDGAQWSAGTIAAGSISTYAYDDRADLRSVENRFALIDGLGLFQWHAESTEPDDDESCFATTNGRWLLEAAHWDVVDAWQLPDDEVRDELLEDAETRLTSSETRLTSSETRYPGRILFGTATQSITSLAATAQTSFAATITGAAVGNHVIVTPPTALGERISVFARVTANNTITIYLNNPSAAAQTLTAGTWRVAVIQEV